MLNNKDILLLQKCFLFKGESEEALSRLDDADCFSFKAFKKGEIIFGEQDEKRLGILLAGKAFALTTECSKSRLKTFTVGELFGAAGVFCEDMALPFSKIEALSSCRVLFITRDGVEKIIFDKPERAIEYIRFLSGRVEFLNRRISTFTSKEALSRVAKHLLSSADQNGICNNINFSALAKSLDISRASLYRAKNELVNLKAISVEDRTVTVLDREALKNIN